MNPFDRSAGLGSGKLQRSLAECARSRKPLDLSEGVSIGGNGRVEHLASDSDRWDLYQAFEYGGLIEVYESRNVDGVLSARVTGVNSDTGKCLYCAGLENLSPEVGMVDILRDVTRLLRGNYGMWGNSKGPKKIHTKDNIVRITR